MGSAKKQGGLADGGTNGVILTAVGGIPNGLVAQRLEQSTHNFQNRLGLLCNYLELQGLTKNYNPLKMTGLDRFGLLFSHAGYNTGYNGNFPRNMGIRSISPLASKPNGLQIKGEPMSTISGSESVRLESAKMVTLAA